MSKNDDDSSDFIGIMILVVVLIFLSNKIDDFSAELDAAVAKCQAEVE